MDPEEIHTALVNRYNHLIKMVEENKIPFADCESLFQHTINEAFLKGKMHFKNFVKHWNTCTNCIIHDELNYNWTLWCDEQREIELFLDQFFINT